MVKRLDTNTQAHNTAPTPKPLAALGEVVFWLVLIVWALIDGNRRK